MLVGLRQSCQRESAYGNNKREGGGDPQQLTMALGWNWFHRHKSANVGPEHLDRSNAGEDKKRRRCQEMIDSLNGVKAPAVITT